MKISIDTKEDSFEDIRKVLQILTAILEKKDSSASTLSTDTTNLMGMFSELKGTVETSGKAPDFGSFLTLAQKNEKKDNPQVEYY